MLHDVEWGEFRIGDLFERIKTKKLLFKADELPKKKTGDYTLPCLTSSFNNQGLNYFAPRHDATILKDVISIPSNSDVYRAYFQSNEFTVLSDAYAIKWIFDDTKLSSSQYLFLVQCINKVTDLKIYSYKNKLGGWNVVKDKKIQLPVRKGFIDYAFMDDFISKIKFRSMAKVKDYFSSLRLGDCTLTQEEKNAISDFKSEIIIWNDYVIKSLFGASTRGKRLKSADRLPGDLPFVTAGETDEGVSSFISNRVNIFSKNTTTIDMFGSAKYRNYDYGADDHVAVVHTDKLPKNAAIFVASSINKSSNNGAFDYGRNFYAKDADELVISLPSKNKNPDFLFMELLISAIQKIVVKDMVEYIDRE